MGGYRQGPHEGDAVLQTVGPFTGVWAIPRSTAAGRLGVRARERRRRRSPGAQLRPQRQGEPALSAVATSTESFGYTSGSPLVTSNGTAAGSAVVWAVTAKGDTGSGGLLRAYAATPVGGNLPLLWSGKIRTASKFAVPTAAEGRVYVGNRKGELIAFGAGAEAPVQAAPVELGSVPVGEESEAATLSLSANRAVTVTGPVTATGNARSRRWKPPRPRRRSVPRSRPRGRQRSRRRA